MLHSYVEVPGKCRHLDSRALQYKALQVLHFQGKSIYLTICLSACLSACLPLSRVYIWVHSQQHKQTCSAARTRVHTSTWRMKPSGRPTLATPVTGSAEPGRGPCPGDCTATDARATAALEGRG